MNVIRFANIPTIFMAVLLAISTRSNAADRTPLTTDFPALMTEKLISRWDFSAPDQAWPVMNQCSVAVTGGILRITSDGIDPYVRVPLPPVNGPLIFRWKMRGHVQGPAEVFFATKEEPDMAKNGSIRVSGTGGGEWHSCEVTIPTTQAITVLRFDPCTKPGVLEVADASVAQSHRHPLQFESVEADGFHVRGTIRNESAGDIAFKLSGKEYVASPGKPVAFEISAPAGRAFTEFRIAAEAEGLPPLERTLYLHDPEAKMDSIDIGNSNVMVRCARDRSGARIFWKGRLVAIATPLSERFAIHLDEDDVLILAIEDGQEDVGMVRVVGPMFQGLLSGVEYLGHGEESSSKLDVARAEHIRFEPDPMLMTMPLAAYVTENASVAMLWWDSKSQHPIFSTPNRYDGTCDHLMGLKGPSLHIRLHFGAGFAAGGRMEDSILWALRKRGLPEPPKSPRTPEQQRALCLSALNGPLRTSNGWYHATWPGQPQHFFVDQASTMFRLTGKIPPVPRLVNTGAHVANPAVWLISGRSAEWLAILKKDAEHTMSEQKPDGSFRYDGKFRRGHFEDTASGFCAINALHLLDCAHYTGDAASRDAGLKALEFMKKFVTPRGAQIWEIPLHTPDILAAADCCRVYLRGYELTGRAEYLDLARRWAIRGLPFVYQWSNHPIMLYGTTPVLGATDWTGVVWIGLPVQWCGSVYAYALTELAPLDHTLDWNRIARGILNCAEQMQYPDGDFVGTLPDSFNLQDQARLPAYVNPCVLVALQLRLAGQLDGIAVAADEKHRIAAPFPVRIENGRAVIEAKAGLEYQVVVDGSRIVDVKSRGRDEIALEAK